MARREKNMIGQNLARRFPRRHDPEAVARSPLHVQDGIMMTPHLNPRTRAQFRDIPLEQIAQRQPMDVALRPILRREFEVRKPRRRELLATPFMEGRSNRQRPRPQADRAGAA